MRAKTIDQKKATGTHRPSRDPKTGGMEALVGIPDAPSYLSPLAAEEWYRVAPEAVRVGVTQADQRALALLCEALATESELRAVIQAEGTTIEGGSGGRKSHPALAALASSRNQAHKLLADFGMLPRSRISLPVKPVGTQEVNPFAEFAPGGKWDRSRDAAT